MNVERLFIGSWFQRTTLHLSEVYDFLEGEESPLKELDPAKLAKLRAGLNLASVEMCPGKLAYAHVVSTDGIEVKLYEDGLINLSTEVESPLADEVVGLRTYYEERLSPALAYLFSLGAPLPKELANIKMIYPYFIVTRDADPAEVRETLKGLGESEHLEVQENAFAFYRGDTYYVIDRKDTDPALIEKLIEEQVFMREFKGQMHRYLNLHRIIWERIAEVKERHTIHGRDIGAFKDKIEGYAKTITLIDARLNQMDAYLDTRKVIATDPLFAPFAGMIEFKHETLSDTLVYIKEIWRMTRNYVDSALDLFGGMQEKATQQSVENLTIVTSMGVGATLIGLFTTSETPTLTLFGAGYFLGLAFIGYAANKIMKRIALRRSYRISDTDADTNIG